MKNKFISSNELKENVKVGDILTKDGKKGKVVKVMDDMANVDFGNGDVYGITFGRIKGKEIVNEEEIDKRIGAEKAIRQTLKDEGGAAGLEPLVKAVKKFGFNKEELVKLLKKVVKVSKHKHGDYILTPINEEVGKEYATFLNALRDSGVTNMFGAAPYLQREFGLDKREAREILANWMKSFSENLDEKISAIVKEKLTKSSSVEDHVEDFKDSDAPQFKGKSLKKIKQMALASFLSKQKK